MVTDKRDDFERLLNAKLSDYREEPPLGIYTRVESSLASNGMPGRTEVGKRRIRTAWLYAFAFVSFFGVVWASSLLFRDNEPVQPQLSEYINESGSKQQTSSMDNIALAQPEEAEAVRSNQPVSKRLRSLLSDTSNLVAKNRLLMAENAEIPDVMAVMATTPDNYVSGSVKSAIVSNAVSDHMWDNRLHNSSRNKNIEDYWRNIFEQEDVPVSPRNSRKGISTSLYAGNFGAIKGDYNALGVSQVAVNDMSITDNKIMFTNSSAGGLVPNRTMLAAPKPELHHKMPVSFGVNVAIPIGNRLSVVTGLSYSYLYSKSSLTEFADYEFSRRLHYLGLPLGLSYDLWDKGRFSLYLYGGGMLERALYGSEVKKIDGSVVSSERLSIKGFQPSVNASLGAMYRISSGMGIYFEPGVSYYFENLKQPASYRTEHPTNISLKVGMKFSLK